MDRGKKKEEVGLRKIGDTVTLNNFFDDGCDFEDAVMQAPIDGISTNILISKNLPNCVYNINQKEFDGKILFDDATNYYKKHLKGEIKDKNIDAYLENAPQYRNSNSARDAFFKISLVIIIALVCSIFLVNFFFLQLYADGVIIKATVIEYEENIGIGDDSGQYFVTYQYFVDGKEYIYRKMAFDSPKVGDEIYIRYQTKNPEKSALVFGANMDVSIALFVALIVFGFLFGLMFSKGLKDRKKLDIKIMNIYGFYSVLSSWYTVDEIRKIFKAISKRRKVIKVG
jgi:hypothetical protein